MPNFRTAGRWAPSLIVCCVALLFGGCTEPGFVAHVLTGPEKVKAVHTFETPRRTLVIVDDPKNALGDPNYPAVVGANVGFHLKKNEVLTAEQIVSQDHLATLAARMGDRYATTPIDQIGSRLNAEQVIYVLIRSVKMQVAGAYYHPVAVVEVKVIDAVNGSRLFPKPGEYNDPKTSPPGHTLSVELKRQTVDLNRRHTGSMLARTLAERVGLQVAQLFYEHVPPDDSPGS